MRRGADSAILLATGLVVAGLLLTFAAALLPPPGGHPLLTIFGLLAGQALVAAGFFAGRRRLVRELERRLARLDLGDAGDEPAPDRRLAPRLEAALDALADRWRQLARRKDDVLTHVSHELKSPLATLRETHLLLLDGELGPLAKEQREILTLNLDGLERLGRMITSMLAQARAEVEPDIERRAADLVATVEQALDSLAPRFAERRVRLHRRLPPAGRLLEIDPPRILQVLENLLDNALRHTPPGGEVAVTLASVHGAPVSLPPLDRRRLGERAHRAVLLEVADSGPGIADAEKPRVFERFHQAGAGRRGGVGLGLTICRQIVEAHDGAIWVEDAEAGGARFRVLLTRRPAPPAILSTPRSARPGWPRAAVAVRPAERGRSIEQISLELRTALYGITGLAESLRLHGKAFDRRQDELLARIAALGKSAGQAVNEVADYGRLQHQDVQPALQPVGLDSLIDVVASRLRSTGADAQLVSELEADLPAVEADPRLLRHVLQRLLRHALDTSAGAAVYVRARRDGEANVRLEVADAAPALDGDQLDQLFRPFLGPSLGLVLAERLVELQGSRLTVESAPGRHNVFAFHLRARRRRPRRAAGSEARHTASTPGLPYRVLAAFSDPRERADVTSRLAGLGHAVVAVSSGDMAWRELSGDPTFDLALLELACPGLSGFAVLRRLRRRSSKRDLPVLLAGDAPDDAVAVLRAGANDFLAKPIDAAELEARVGVHLRRVSAFRALGGRA